jgi:hypothetical protein
MPRPLLIAATLLLVLAGVARPAGAQSPAEAPAQTKTFGIIGGVDFATLAGSDVSNTSSRTGFMGGLFLGVMVGRSVEVEPEVLYSMKGSSFTDSDTTLALDYIEVPILVKLHLQPEGGMYLLAGPAADFHVSCKAVGAITIDCADFGLSPNLTFGGIVGLGYTRGRVGVEGRYDFDFSDALALDQFTNLNAKNRVWAILARVSL